MKLEITRGEDVYVRITMSDEVGKRVIGMITGVLMPGVEVEVDPIPLKKLPPQRLSGEEIQSGS